MQLQKLFKILLLSLLLVAPFSAFAQGDEAAEEAKTKAENKEYILHHLKDSYSFHVVANVSFPLPILLWDKGVHFFMSSAFDSETEHETAVAECDGKFYKLNHHDNKIYETDAQGTITMDQDGHPTNNLPFDFSITKNVFTLILVMIFMFWLFRNMAKNYSNSLVPKGAAKFLEPVILFVRDEIAIPNIGEKKHGKFMGFLLSVFFFIWIVNLLGLTPMGINITGNIAITAALAIMTFFVTMYTSKSAYWTHIFWMPGVPVPMKFILAPIELLGVFIKPFALLIRLYANMTAGHVVIGSLIALLYIFHNVFAQGAFLGLTFFLSLIELLVAFLQAYIFTMLSALYFGAAVEEHHHEEAHH